MFWSSVEGKPYPLSVRAFSFEEMYPARDKDYNAQAGATYAAALAEQDASGVAGQPVTQAAASDTGEAVDHKAEVEQNAIDHLKKDSEMMRYLDEGRAFWSALMAVLQNALPKDYDSPATSTLLRKALDQICGEGQWEEFRDNSNRNRLTVRKKPTKQ